MLHFLFGVVIVGAIIMMMVASPAFRGFVIVCILAAGLALWAVIETSRRMPGYFQFSCRAGGVVCNGCSPGEGLRTMAKCFVIGPIGEAGSTVRADADDFMKYIVTPVVTSKDLGYEAPIRADSLNEPGRITSQIITLLMEADLVIADLTGNNPNVFYELCLRHTLGKPVIHMATDGTVLPFDVRDNRTIFYTMHSRVAESARSELEKQIRHIQQTDYKAMNPILETVGIVNLERSADPAQKALGQLMGMVERLSSDVQGIRQDMRVTANAAMLPRFGGYYTHPSFLETGGSQANTPLTLRSADDGVKPKSE